ncbi:VOC family protein [Nocardioides anomalus]|uniref:VOC family protein n=1 Tax=Nocardioides anomalus TaxID=2712223 RepID=A0A6G6WEY5_9ACTN|nr:VOC family protein [Nocardioides anomalus]QIG43717.1 VOC family protein [Nocardioides anomalus]
MTSRLAAVTYDALDPERLTAFWDALVPSAEHQVALRFVAGTPPAPGTRTLHLHLTSESAEHQRATVDQALALGGSHLDVGQRPDEGHVVLADPEGNAFCVIEPGNSYLAGTGFLGEVACDGSRAVGVFWSEALGWPLVWDEDGETAVQSPHGGTKVAWGGGPETAKLGRNPQRFTIGADEAEVERLLGLGATRLSEHELADPDGNEVELVPPS